MNPHVISNPIDELYGDDTVSDTELIEDKLVRLENDYEELKNNYHVLESIIDEDERLWRAMSEDRSEYDLPRDKQYDQMRRAWAAFCTNPIAYRHVITITNFVTGEDMRFTSPVPEIEEWINDFWYSPTNQMPFRIKDFANEFTINGNVFIRFWISHETGKVACRGVPPTEIREIIHDPDDVDTIIYFKREFTKSKWVNEAYQDERVEEYVPSVDVIRNKNLLSKVEVDKKKVNIGIRNNQDSYIYHFKAPTVSGRKWGMTQMASHLFWLREYKTLLRHITNLNKARSAYVMDVKVMGSENDVQLERKKHRVPPTSGSVLVHSDRIEYDFKNPNTGSANTAADLRAIKLMSVAGSGMPEHIITGDASNANFASTKSTNYPFMRMMQAYQEFWGAAYKYGILWVVLWAAHTYGPLEEKYDIDEYSEISKGIVTKNKKSIECIDVQFPLIDREEIDRLATAMRVYAEIGIASKQSMSTLAGFRWRKEKPIIDAETEEQMGQAADQQAVMADMQNQAAMGAITPQLMMAKLQGEQDIDLAAQAKVAGVPEASPAMMNAMSTLGGGAAAPGGEQPLMQSRRYVLRDNTVIFENREEPLRSRKLKKSDENNVSQIKIRRP